MHYIQILQDAEASVKLVKRSPRVLFLGMQGSFTWPCLQALLVSGIDVCAVVIPASRSASPGRPAISRKEQQRTTRSILPVLNSSLHSNIVQLAWERQIPVWEVSRMSDPVTALTLAEYQPDVICVACFSQHIPHAILDIPPLGCLNVHPSLLPANRGPEPLFWAFRQGLQQTGVTIHLMDEGMDTGDLLAQEVIQIADGMSYAQLESECAMRGGALLAQAVWELYTGLAIRVSQDERVGAGEADAGRRGPLWSSSYQSFPSSEDFIVPVAEWSARHVYNFICGVAEWDGPVKLHVDGKFFAVKRMISYSPEDMCKTPGAAYCWRGEELWVRCKAGWVGVITLTT